MDITISKRTLSGLLAAFETRARLHNLAIPEAVSDLKKEVEAHDTSIPLTSEQAAMLGIKEDDFGFITSF